MIPKDANYKLADIVKDTWPQLYYLNTKKMIYLFSKESCGPCRLVDKYFESINDNRIKVIKKIDLEDVSDQPIPKQNLDLAKKYGVTATPVLVVTDTDGIKIKEYIGGLEITKNIKSVLDDYA